MYVMSFPTQTTDAYCIRFAHEQFEDYKMAKEDFKEKCAHNPQIEIQTVDLFATMVQQTFVDGIFDVKTFEIYANVINKYNINDVRLSDLYYGKYSQNKFATHIPTEIRDYVCDIISYGYNEIINQFDVESGCEVD